MTIPHVKMSGPELLRMSANIIAHTNPLFANGYTAEQLLTLCRAKLASEWDFTPDQWQPRQVREALRGIVPRWRDDPEKGYVPLYDGVEVLPKGTRVRVADGYQWNLPMACLNGAVGTVLFSYKDQGCADLLFCGPIAVRWIDGTKIRQREFFFEDLEVVEDEE